MPAVVTGATGYLGRRIVRALCEDGAQVRCVVRPSGDVAPLRDFVGDLWRRVEIVRLDLSDGAACRAVLFPGDGVYHVAAGMTGSTSTLFLNSVVPTRLLLDAARDAQVARFVLVSSLAVYASGQLQRGALLDERTPVDPQPHLRDPYTFSKVIQEQAGWEAERKGLPLVVVRPGVIFGPGRGVLSGRVGLTVGGRMIRMGGRQMLPYTYVENCAAAIVQAGLAPNVTGEAFNIVDDNLPTASTLFRKLRKLRQAPRSVRVPHALIQPLSGLCEWYHRRSRGQLPGVITRYRSAAMWTPLRYSNEKAKSRLHWTPRVSFEEAVMRSIEAGEGKTA